MEDKIKYFGYGANSDPEMMEAVTGTKLEGTPFVLKGFRFGILRLPELPRNVQRILRQDWDSNFRIYSLVRGADNNSVRGVLWELTDQQLALVHNWELIGLLPQEFTVYVEGENSNIFGARTVMITDPIARMIVNGESYPPFLNDRERMLSVARRSREVYLKEQERKSLIER